MLFRNNDIDRTPEKRLDVYEDRDRREDMLMAIEGIYEPKGGNSSEGLLLRRGKRRKLIMSMVSSHV